MYKSVKHVNKDNFIDEFRKVHGNKYDYSLSEYEKNYKKLKIICPIHGIFETTPNNHLNDRGCPYCVGKNQSTEDVIKRFRKVHDDKYDYSLVKYISDKIMVKIICPIHGVFEQYVYSHYKGHGCSKCSNNSKYTQDEFITKSKQVHNNRYDYSLVDFKNMRNDEVKIICPIHGIFEQKPYNHVAGSGCPICGGSKKSNNEDFVEKSNMIHDFKYDYSLVDYKNCMEKVKIICKKHGIFEQTPNKHLGGQGCPKCNQSKGETNIEIILKREKIDYKTKNFS